MINIKSDLFEYEIYDSRIVIFDLLQDKMIIIDGIDYINLKKALCITKWYYEYIKYII